MDRLLITREAVETCACLQSRRLARILTRMYDAELAPAGITIAQFNLLITLQLSSGLPITKLAAALDFERTTLTRNLGHLERKGLVSFAAGTDTRQRLVSITKAGQRKLSETLPLWQKAQAKVNGQQVAEQVAAIQLKDIKE
jgi:DNA-binding MarR family transcriptional regulator